MRPRRDRTSKPPSTPSSDTWPPAPLDLFAPVLAHLREANEARTASDIEAHFVRQFDIRDVATVCEYLADLGLISKVSLPARLTRRSSVDVQELAFVHFGSDRA